MDLTVAGNTWYSLVVSVNGDQVRIEVRQVRGVPGAAVARTVTLQARGAGAEIKTLRLAAAGVSAIGSAINGFNGKIGTPSFYDRALTLEETANLHSGDGSGPKPRLCWNLAETFNSRELRELSGAPECNADQRCRTCGDRPQLDRFVRFLPYSARTLRSDCFSLG